MELSEENNNLLVALDPFFDRYDETSKTFQDYLSSLNLEIEKVYIPYYNSPFEFVWNIVHYEERLEHYAYIDKSIYNKIEKILNEIDRGYAIDGVSSILKKGYYKTLLAKLNVGFQKDHREFADAFYELYKLISKDIVTAKLITNKTESLTVKNNTLLNLLINSFKDQVLKSTFSAEYITNYELKRLGLDLNEEEFYVIYTCQDLLEYIRSNKLVKNELLGDLFDNRVYKGECELIFDLLDAAGIIDEGTVKSPASNFIRSKLTNHQTKSLKDIDAFSDYITYTEEGFEMNFTLDNNRMLLNGNLINSKGYDEYKKTLNINLEKLKAL